MAKNPRWNLSRSTWRQQFAHWIHNADPQELLELNMLFDFRCVAGQQHFARELRTWVFDEMESYPLFFIHFAQNALLYKPPLSLLRQPPDDLVRGGAQGNQPQGSADADRQLRPALRPEASHRLDEHPRPPGRTAGARRAQPRDVRGDRARLRDADAHPAAQSGHRASRRTASPPTSSRRPNSPRPRRRGSSGSSPWRPTCARR